MRDVLPGGPADLHQRKLKTGDVILAIDGKKVDPSIDLTEILNGRLERDIQLTVQTTNESKEDADKPTSSEHSLTIRPISYRRARALLYDHWLNTIAC